MWAFVALPQGEEGRQLGKVAFPRELESPKAQLRLSQELPVDIAPCCGGMSVLFLEGALE